MSKNIKLIVGLGNPGEQYNKTRHNVGFLVTEQLRCNIHSIEKWKLAMHAEFIEFTTLNGQKVVIIKPQTYMNNSGVAVAQFVKYYGVEPKDILLIHDDIDLELGRIKLKAKGSGGGHNGVNDVLKALNTKELNRIKIGVGKDSYVPIKKWVLSSFRDSERKKIQDAIVIAANICLSFIDNQSFESLMNWYNKSHKNEQGF